MTRAESLLLGVWEFIVGDDWRTAIGVVLALGATALLAAAGSSAWFAMALAVPALLGLSIRRAARDASGARDASEAPGASGGE